MMEKTILTVIEQEVLKLEICKEALETYDKIYIEDFNKKVVERINKNYAKINFNVISYLNSRAIKNNITEKDSESNEQLDSDIKNKNKLIKYLYNKLMIKLHPDKAGENKIDMYTKVEIATRENNLIDLIKICNEVDIIIPDLKNYNKELRHLYINITNKIEKIKQSPSWKYNIYSQYGKDQEMESSYSNIVVINQLDTKLKYLEIQEHIEQDKKVLEELEILENKSNEQLQKVKELTESQKILLVEKDVYRRILNLN